MSERCVVIPDVVTPDVHLHLRGGMGHLKPEVRERGPALNAESDLVTRALLRVARDKCKAAVQICGSGPVQTSPTTVVFKREVFVGLAPNLSEAVGGGLEVRCLDGNACPRHVEPLKSGSGGGNWDDGCSSHSVQHVLCLWVLIQDSGNRVKRNHNQFPTQKTSDPRSGSTKRMHPEFLYGRYLSGKVRVTVVT